MITAFKKTFALLLCISFCFCNPIKTSNKYQNNIYTETKKDRLVIVSDTLLSEQKINIITPLENVYAPYFALPNKDGRIVTSDNLLQYKKKLLVFTDRTCDHCTAFYPELEKFAQKHKNDFYVVAIQYDTNTEQLQKFTSEKKYHFNMLAANDAVFIDYKIMGTPTIMLLDEKNFIQKNNNGLFSLQELEELFL
ncbi:TlpA disulfide reductase family protein [uncultured Tenacibaculum sp.]|uniref:TlpA family protein disulfide reductase n=1 Tax=uncultured Tenacibaculum sp. TaxID=174713 RepID=UPI00260E162D|nr:TlpA disulfide reductase family protein [uncultured Tenacibaculum sp.]